MPRLFLTIALPDEVRDVLSGIGGGVAGARWLDYDQLHMTLVFLGDVHQAKMTALCERFRGVRWSGFELHIRDLGCFPLRGRPRALWAGVSANDQLLSLQRRLTASAVEAGVHVRRRKYHPHVTLARFSHGVERDIADYLARNAGLDMPRFTVEAFELWQSHLGAEGASYSVIERFGLPLEPNSIER